MASEEKLFDYLKRASAELQETRTRLRRMEAAEQEPIAIVSLGCRFPGGIRDRESFWDVVASGTDTIAGFPTDRGWEALRPHDPDSASLSFAYEGGFIYDVAEFDAGFFGISPREALAMDPQQRLVLEVAWESLERARIEPRSLRGSATGVFIGSSSDGYGTGLGEADASSEGYLLTGTQTAMISGRLAYTLGLEGPALTVDTACSSALVAVHLAAQALRSGNCSLAVAGGVAVLITPAVFAEFSRQRGISGDGRSKAFAGAADGMGWGEGAGLVVLERLSDARRNGHPVLALITGTAVNQDGASNGLTAPNGPSQQRVIREALANARVRADQVDLVEGHGTGTVLGDPIEAQALLATYGQNRPDGRPVWLGSVKSNLGHTQAAGGAAGIIKMVLALQHELMPPTLHIDEPSPKVDWSVGDVQLLTEPVPWPANGQPRRAGISAFGASGTNAHVIVQEAPAPGEVDGDLAEQAPPPGDALTPAVPVLPQDTAWLVSARTANGLRAQAERLAEFTRNRADVAAQDLTDIGWSLATTRSSFEHRAVVLGGDRPELLSGLSAVAAGEPAASVVTGTVAAGGGAGRVVFVFPGQGGQWVGMGQELARTSPVFAARLAECAEALVPFVDWSLDEVLNGADGAPSLTRLDVVHPALWAVMVSLAAVWEASGVRPHAVIGHSQGEIAAACVAGVLSLSDGARVVARRGRAMLALAGRGGVLSIAASRQAVEARLAGHGPVSVATVNGPEAVTVSGAVDALQALAAECERDGVRARFVPMDYAPHGPQVESIREVVLAAVEGVTPRPSAIPLVSGMTGDYLDGPEMDADYWYASLRATVQFTRGVERLRGDGYGVFVEVSPHPVLTTAVTATLESTDGPDGFRAAAVVTGTLRRDDGGPARVLASLAEAYVRGVAVDWPAVLTPGQSVDLPTYAFQRQRFWANPVANGPALVERDSAAQARFWAAVENGDVDLLADTLAVDGQRLDVVVPALASWRRREREDSATADWRYRISWVPVPDPAPAALDGTWLVVAPTGGSGGELVAECVRALTAAGAEMALAEVPSAEVDQVTLAVVIREVLARSPESPPVGVVSLLALDETSLPEQPVVNNGLAGTLGLVQALGQAGISAPLWVLTSGAVAAAAGELLSSPTQAQVWGLGRVAGLEHPDRWGGLIDLPSVLDARAAGRLVGVLAGCGEDQVAVRSAGVVGRRLVRSGPSSDASVWAPRGTVLVTGVSGGIGPNLARWLADAGAVHLTLVSRRAPMLPGVAAMAAALATGGTSVSLVACDVTDRGAVAGLLAWIDRTGPVLSTVIHGANAVELRTLSDTGVSQLALALGAKVAGAIHLDELTADLDLDEFVLFSSIAATWGVSEHGAYAAANAHLDALAENRRARGLPATSVGWGVWDTGQASDGADLAMSVIPERLRRQGLRLLDPAPALAALGRVLADDETVLTVADIDWSRFAAVFNAARAWRLLDDIPEARQAESGSTRAVVSGEAAELLDRLTGVSSGQRDRIVTDLVVRHAAAVLGHTSLDAADASRAFREMGFDSLTAVDLRGRLNEATGLRLPATVVFDYPSPVMLARQIVSELMGTQQVVSTSRVTPVSATDPVVIVGMGCRFPGGVDSPESMWELLATGRDAVGGFPLDRGWDIAGLLDAIPGQALTSVTSEGGFVAGAADFDPGFFRISPREALAMDPQQRLFLETSWEAMEYAGVDPVSLRGSSTGVFAGAASSGYVGQAGLGADLDDSAGHLMTGNVPSVISGRVSYTLGLEGPAVTVDTACSSALVSLHLAAQALRAGECDLALAGGVMVIADPAEFIGFSQQGALAPNGRSKAFSADADGMGLAEGAGVVVLERLSDARRNGHPVLAVLAGSAINQDGASNGLTAPNGPSQQRVIRAALASAGLAASDVDAVEAHGTGTRLGDPIEAQALLATYGRDRREGRPLWLGSVKSNFGHAQHAAGVAGVIKMVLALRNGVLPATLHVDAPSPQVDWSAGDVQLLTEPVDWAATGRPRRAGVSSFGISGTNAHLILEEAPRPAEADVDEEPVDGGPVAPVAVVSGGTAWVVSSQTASGLGDQARRLAEHLATRPDLGPVDVGWSSATTRSVFEHRAVVTGTGREELVAGLGALAANRPAAGVVGGVAAGTGPVVFVFPGQGSQWVGMGRELAASSPVFAGRLAECAKALAPYVDWSLDEVLAGAEGAPGFDRVDVVQPVLWAVMVSLAEFWQAAGVQPDAVVGHSQGEIAAAVVAGILSLEDAAKVVALRSRALLALSGRGGMLSVAESVAAVRARVASRGGRISVAAVNGPVATVVSGEPEALAEVLAGCERDGVRARMLPVDYASHGPQVDQLREEVLSLLAGIEPRPGQLPMVSAMTGEYLAGPELVAEYWYASLRATVDFSRAVEVLGRDGYGVFVETSAHPVLTAAITETLEHLRESDEGSVREPVVTGTLRRDDGGPVRALASLAEVHVQGVGVDWAAVLPVGQRVELPTYAFQRQRYWPKPVPVSSGSGVVPAAEGAFWAAVENGDVASLADTLAVDGQRLREVLPALTAWRRRERGESTVVDWRYGISWEPVAVPSSAMVSGTWLVVAPAGAAGASHARWCVQALTDHGAQVVLAEIAEGELDRQMLAGRIGDLLRPGAEVGDEAPVLAGVVSLLALDETSLPEQPVVNNGLAGTLGLVQALGQAGISAPLWVLTSGAVAAAAGELLSSPTQAQVWGLGRVAGLEHPDRWGGLIDLPSVLDARAAGRLVGVLAGCGEDQVAVRSAGVVGRRLVRSGPSSDASVWAPRGTVLVTGVSGGIGPNLARWLADAGAVHLTLVSRRAPMLPGVAAMAAALATGGTSVSLVACDVTDRGAVAGLLAWIDRTGPVLSTVIHGANAVELRTLSDTGVSQLALALGAKVAGAIHLDELTADLDLDEFVLFSSIAATWGVSEHGAYAAANAHLDALAENRRARGLPATSVGWGVWDTGQASDGADLAMSVIPERLRRQGLRLLDPAPALAALGRVLADDETAVAVVDVDWPLFSAVFNAKRSWPLLVEISEAREVGSSPAGPATVSSGEAVELLGRLVGATPGQRERIVADLVRAHAAAVLGHASASAVEPGRAFREMGFDSVTAVELRGRLNQATGLRLPSTVVFDYPSPVMLARQIVSLLLGAQTVASAVSRVIPVSGTDPVVIVGLGCRFPGGVDGPEALWELLSSGGDAIGGFPADRGWDVAGLLNILNGSESASAAGAGGFVAGAADFDAGFFRISPREALAMDPQQRLLLETSWEALEHAGLDPESLRGSLTGVFVGASSSGYFGHGGFTEDSAGHLITGNVASVISGRVSYTLGLEGPAVTVDTACSSALVSAHLAAQALRAGECDLALAGGVMVIADPAEFIGFSQQGALAADGRCKAFSADADGMGLAEGAGMIVLERLSDARRNGHPVLAVVAGSAVNQDGASNGLSAPNGPSQQRVIRAALASAGLAASDVDAVEAHGTGTRLGDPIEAQALLATYGQGRPENRPLWLGSVKSNIGHAQHAAGAAGILKTVLALRHGRLPATLHADVASPQVDWSVGEVRLLTEPRDWSANGRPRRAGVSSFGISGTNAHLILEEPPADTAPQPSDDPADPPTDRVPVLTDASAWSVSSQTRPGLVAQVHRLVDHLAVRPELDRTDVGWSLATTRSVFEHRAVVTGTDRDELVAGLRALAANEPAPGMVAGTAGSGGPVVFVFPGQGSQWVGMGRELAESSPVFAARLTDCGRALAPFVDWSLDDVLAGVEGAPGFDRVDVVQPALWAVMVSLAAVWQAAGVQPDAVLGHSQGEIAAAVVAGALSLEDAAKVVALRSRALLALSGRGGMLSVAESAEAVRGRVLPWGERISVAAVNGPVATVVSGEPEALAEVLAGCERDGVRARMLPVDYASHGPQVDQLREEVLSLLAGIEPRPGQLPMVSAMTGEYLAGPELVAEYWYASLRATVDFSRAVEVLGRDGYGVFVETSAHPVLTTAITDTLEGLPSDGESGVSHRTLVVTGTLRRDDGGAARLLTSLAEAHVHGVPVRWAAVLPVGQRIELPTYAFQRQRYWPEPAPAARSDGDAAATEAENAFWAAVTDGDVDGAAETLAVDGDRLRGLLPALAAWRRRERGESAVADWRYRITWRSFTPPSRAALSGTWLVVAPAGTAYETVTADCRRALTGRGARVQVVEITPGELTRPALRDRVTRSLDMPWDGPAVSGIVSLLATDVSPWDESPVVARGLVGTMSLVQALGDAGVDAPLWVVTVGAVAAVTGEVPVHPVPAQSWAFGRVAALEHNDRWGGLLDLPPTWDARTADSLVSVLAGCGEDQVAIRAGGVLGRRLVRAPRVTRSGPGWKPAGSVLVTGGTGGIGGNLARWLTSRDAARIVLSSRSGAAAAGVPALVAELAGAGTAVAVLAGDVGDLAETAGLLHWIDTHGPALSSVMHAAGVGLGGPLDTMVPADLTWSFQAKAGGAGNLDELTADRELDAFVVFSSGAAAWGGTRLAGYAAANAALDALVEDRRGRGLAGTSVSWGLWGGGGMAEGAAGEALQRLGLREMDPRTGVAALAASLDAGEALVTVADIDWDRFATIFTVHRPSALLAELPEAQRALDPSQGAPASTRDAAGTELGRRLTGLNRAEQDRLLTDLVRAEAAAVLGHASAAAVPAGRPFKDLGFDSITAVDLRTRLNTATGLRLAATLVFDYPTPAVAAEFLRTELLGILPHSVTVTPAHATAEPGEPIAIVGMGCRFPGDVREPEDLWDLVAAGTDTIAGFPTDRGWDPEGLYAGLATDAATALVGGFVYDAAEFDPAFFGISPREALTMDPQQRMLLETAWEAVERAGIDPASLKGSATGVFAGAAVGGYGHGLAEEAGTEGYLMIGGLASVISGRISYTLGLEGPAVTVDTACSSALVALHLACQALRARECSLALAGGVAVMSTPGAFAEFSRQQGLAFDGRCKAFAAGADGIGWGEGAGMLVLERLSDARRGGHRVLAVVAGSAMNQDGASNGLTAPNGPSQQRVIRTALANAGLRADQVDAVEAHGTGTVLGDPIEAQALLATYGQDRPEGQPLWLGSVKSNIGHTQTAAGVAGVIKMVLALRHGLLPRTLHAEEPSPHVDWSAGEVRLLTEPKPWTANGHPRRAGVSAFGVSGTNAHVIIEEAPATGEPPRTEGEPELVVPVLTGATTAWLVSARSGTGLVAQAGRLGEFVAARPELDVAEVAWSLSATRSAFEHRAVVVGQDRAELLSALSAVAGGRPAAGAVSGVVAAVGVGRVVLVFPGQGSQWVGMGLELAASSPVFAARLAECGRALAPYVDWSLDDVLAGRDGAPGFDRVDVVQPVLWAVMVSLAAVWEAAGVVPEAVVGHSQGEIAAAVVAGILSLRDAATVVALRSRALLALSGRGGMLSIAEPVDAVRDRLARWDGQVSVAAVNGPDATVVSGDLEALRELLAECERDGARARVLPVDYASHGPQVDRLRAEIADVLAGIAPRPGRLPMVSAMTGEFLEGPELDADYWYASLRGTVRFSEAITTLDAAGYGVFLETSPHPVLTSAITSTLEAAAGEDSARPVPVVAGTLRRDDGGPARLLASLAEVHVRGVALDWSTLVPRAEVVELPTYAFQRQRYWPKPVPASVAVNGVGGGSAAESRFWSAVEAGDLEGLSQTLSVGGRALGELVPALASWRQRERDESLTADWRYRVSWTPMREAGPATLSGTWLVVVPADLATGDLAVACRRMLEDRGAHVELTGIPSGDLDRHSLATRIGATLGSAPLDGVLSLLGLDESPLAGRPPVPSGVAGTLGLVQALGEVGTSAPLWVVTQGAVTTGGDVLVSPVQAQLWGMGRTAGVEHPDRWGGLVDLPSTLDGPELSRLAGVLAARGEDQVAIRAGGVLVRRLVRAAPRRKDAGAWRPRGSVLLTGASGAIGPDLAAWLADAGVEHAVLSSRRGPGTAGAAALAALLAEAGSAVSMVACDITDRDAVAGLLAGIPRHGPALSTVIHAAVVAELTALDHTDVDQLALALGAKVVGARNLDELTAELDLDAFVLFSSIAATWGVGEHGAYAAANAHLDALAENRRARGLPATSVAWGVWSSGGRFDVSAGAAPAPAGSERPLSLIPERLRRQGLRLLDPERALAVLGQVLADDETSLSVADVDWPRFSAVFNAARSWPLLESIAETRAAESGPAGAVVASGEAAALRERLVDLPAGQREQIVTGLVSGHAAAVLGYASADEVDAHRAFRDMGFDSLTAVELRGRLNQATGLTLPSTVVFDYPSPVMLAREIVSELLGSQQLARTVSRVTPVSASDPVVIVGMGCRFPGGVDSPEAMWELLSSGGDAIGGFPVDRGWDIAGLLDSIPGQLRASVTSEGGFVTGAADFDPGFFRISPREALAMDPQQRLLLEASWEAMEHAGLDPVSLRGSLTGVFAGAASSGYSGQAGFDEDSAGHLITGNVTSVISGRVSYTLGLEGPAVTVDTACSSALVSLHLAAQALRAGECDLALAGGVMVIADPGEFVGFSAQGALALDGRCKAFSAEADGMGLAEGAGMIVLERLSDARRNGHVVLAVVAGSAVNQDGASNGLSAPNGPSQQRVIRAALASAGLGPSDVDAVEAHGTGTRLGDPIEAQALLATYGQDRPDGRPLWLGSVKSNIGHAQQASGAAGVIKMVLALRHGVLPATLHADVPSPHVDWSAGDVQLLTEPVQWAGNGRPRRAGVSAFGISGTNAHIILEEPLLTIEADDDPADRDQTEVGPAEADPVPVLSDGTAWLVSGQTAAGLVDQAGRLAEHVATRPGLDPVDVGWSLATTRSVFEHRAVVTGTGREELVAGLGALAANQPAPGVVTGQAAGAGPLVLVFPGQGSQWAGMGRELAACSPVFAARLAECGQALAPYVDWSLDEVLAGAEGAPGFDRVDVVQPVLWAVMVSLAEFWRAAGVVPDAVVGHSQGEIAAAVVAGILSLEDGAKVVALRSRALLALSGRGGMLSIAEPVEAALDRVTSWGARASVAAVNGPAATVVSGDLDALAELLADCERDGVRARMLPVDYASHGPQVDAIRDEVLGLLGTITPRSGVIAMVSAMTGEFLEGPELDAGYWYASLRAGVQFGQAVEALGRAGYGVFIETSAHPVLTAAITETLENLREHRDADEKLAREPVVVGTLRRDDGGSGRVLASLAEVHVQGVAVEWASVLPAGRRVELPTYAFQRQRYWPKPGVGSAGSGVVPAAEGAFWAAVEGGDLESLSQTLAVDGQHLGEVLPALAAWRRRESGGATAADWRYRITWAPVAVPSSARLSGDWLVVAPAAGSAIEALVAGCREALSAGGARVLLASIAPEEGGRQSLRDRIARTVHELGNELPLSGIVSLLALDESSLDESPVVARGLATTMGLTQALGDAGIAAPLWVLTSGAVAAGAGEVPTGPVQAQSWALGRVVGLEHPDRWGGLIDLPPEWGARTADRLVAVLAGSGEDQVAIRAGGVLGRRLVRARRLTGSAPGWRPAGSVLVTGGTGGVGGHVARWLTERGAARIVLSSRSGPGAPGAAGLVAELATAGTDVAVLAGDVGDRGQAAGLVSWVGSHGPALSSIMHAAGVVVGGPLDTMATADLVKSLQAKSGGANHLDQLTSDLDLDAFVVFSSGASAWGSARLSCYAAANAALDALVEDRRGRGLAGTSVAWGLWGGGGMGEGPAGEVLQRLGLREMDPGAAVGALAAVLDAGEDMVLVSDIDWDRFAPLFTVHRPSPLLADLPEAQRALDDTPISDDGAEPAGTALSQRLEGLDRPEQDRVLIDLVRTESAAVLGYGSVDAVPAERAFKDLGFDSITAVDLRTRLNTATGLRLPATLVFDYPTPIVLADFIRSRAVNEQTDYAMAVAELKKLQAVLSRITWNGEERFDITSRLESIGQELRARESGDDPGTDHEIESATDDEMFDFVEKELRAAEFD